MVQLGSPCVAAIIIFLLALQHHCNGGWINNRDVRSRLKRQARAWSNVVATARYKTYKETNYANLKSALNTFESDMES